MRKNKLILMSTLVLFLTTIVAYGQDSAMTEKGGAALAAKRPSIWANKITNTSLTNLYKVDEGIFRCEQPDQKSFQELADLGIKSVLNLRNKHSDSLFLQDSPLNCFKVNMEAKDIADDEMIQALKALRDAPKPIVVHCKHGADRTGAVIAMYRIVFQDWTKEKAIGELKYGGFGFHEAFANIPVYIQQTNVAEMKKIVLKK
jgi:tyrosine-protein phosphatase SIW14